MSGPVTRNTVVRLLGTPQWVEGSLNDPVEREESGIHYNEKWLYQHLPDDPAGAAERTVYWHRYDFIATMVRADQSAEWRPDQTLIEVAKAAAARLPELNDRQPTYGDNGRYRPVSRVQDSRDLGGYVQDQATGRSITTEDES